MKFEDLSIYRPTPLEDAIQKLHKQLEIVSPYEIDLDLITEQFGIEVRYLPHDTNTLHMRNTYYLIVDNRLPEQQQRVEMAHELGHILKHSGSQLDSRMPRDFRALQEWQADRFAMYLLVPTFILANCLTSAYSRQQMVRQLAEAFNVTEIFMDVRLDILEQRIRSLQWDKQVSAIVAEERQMYDYSYRHPTNPRIEYLVKDHVIIGTRRRTEF